MTVRPTHLIWAILTGLVGALAALLLASSAQAVPAAPGVITVSQPDGSTFKARQFGDEWYNGTETKAGHTVLQGKRGWWKYAEQAEDGTLRPSDTRVGEGEPTMRKHLRDRKLVNRAERLSASVLTPDVELDPEIGDVARAPMLGSQKSLVILAQFTDQGSLGTTPAQWANAYFGGGKSLADYYDEVSAGQFGLSPAAETHGTVNDGVVGWVNLGVAHPNQANIDDDNRNVTKLAIQAADTYVNYASYDTNGDGYVSNTELHVTVIAAGQEASCCQASGGKFLWGHKWQLVGSQIPTVDGKLVGAYGYTQFGEMHGTHIAALGIMAHEIGHDLGLPDLYDGTPAGAASSYGVGLWSLMGYGSWLGLPTDSWGTQGGQTPPYPDAWSRSHLGWLTPQTVSGTEVKTINAASTGVNNAAVRVLDNPGGPFDWTWNGFGVGQYFLVENRQPTAGTYDASLPAGGLLVMHVNEPSGDNNTDTARLIDIEEADGLNQLDSKQNVGNAGDLYRGGGNTTFNDASNPNSKLNNGTASGVSMTGVSASSASMTATFTGPGGSSAPANDNFANASTVNSETFDATVNNLAATTEAGETSQAGCNIGRTVWWKYTPTRNVRISAYTTGSNFDTVLEAWRGTSINALTGMGCNDDASPNTTSIVPEFEAQAGQTYYFQGGGYYNATAGTVEAGDLQLHIRVTSAPNAPTGVSATAGDASANVSWTPGAANGSPITGYTVTSSPGNITKAVAAGSTNTTVTGLSNGTAYTFTVTATNAIGTSPPSSASNSVTPQAAATAPNAPTGVSATAGDASAGVSWTAPASNGSPITGYTVTSSPGNITKAVAAGSTNTTVTGLSNGTAYTFTVTATNAIGTSPPSSASNSVTPQAAATAPDAPTGVSATAGNATADVSWTPGAANGSPITGYTVTSSPGNITKNVTAGTTNTSVTGLNNGTAYTFTVTATNGIGTSPASAASNAVTPQAPADPTDLGVAIVAVDLPGQEFGYQATVARTGDADAAAVDVTVELPGTVDLDELPDGCTGTTTLTCDVGTVASGDSNVLDIVVLPRSEGPHTATASVDVVDAVGSNDSATAQAGVTEVCDNAPTSGGDHVVGSNDDEVLCGLAGNDTIDGGGGDDLIFGGSGKDTASYADSTAGMIVNLGFQTLDSDTAWPRGAAVGDGYDRMTGMEQVEGSEFGDKLLGRNGPADKLTGLGGADLLYGYAGKDKLYGGNGKDKLYGGADKDRLNGGDQKDLCSDKKDIKTSCER